MKIQTKYLIINLTFTFIADAVLGKKLPPDKRFFVGIAAAEKSHFRLRNRELTATFCQRIYKIYKNNANKRHRQLFE